MEPEVGITKEIACVFYQCNVCHRDFVVEMPERLYRFDGTILAIARDHAWCNRESVVVEAEVVDSPEMIASTLRFLEAEEAERGPDGETDVEEWRLRLRFVQQRKSPAHCLSCGSTDFLRMADPTGRPNEVLHTGCGGRIQMKNLTLFHSKRPVVYYTPEGAELPGQ